MGTFSCMPFKSPNESLSSTIKEACSRLYVEDVNFIERGFVVFVRYEGRPGQIDGTLSSNLLVLFYSSSSICIQAPDFIVISRKMSTT